MATFPTTLGGLRTRIISESNRDDLEDELADALDQVIADAIEYYAAERWWWNEARATSTTTAANEYTNRPTGARIIDVPFLLIGGVRYDINKRSMEWIEGMYTTPLSGQPTDYCEFGAQVRWWPTPNDAYTIVWLDIADATALDYSSAASTNVWTVNAAPLLSARARMTLFRDYFKADADYGRAEAAERQWYGRLKGETNRRLGTGRLRPSP
jgi:hypothetical protein